MQLNILLDITPANQFFTTESLFTFSGASAITFVVANGIQKAFDYSRKWLGVLIAMIVCLLAVYMSDGKDADYVIAVINGFLVFNTAAGSDCGIRKAQSCAARGKNYCGYPKKGISLLMVLKTLLSKKTWTFNELTTLRST